MLILLNVFLVLFFVSLNAFFVLAEFAMVKVRKSRIELLASKGSITAKYAQRVVNDLNNYLSACQLGITLASLALGWLGEPTVAKMISPLLNFLGLSENTIHLISIGVGFLIITGLHIVLGELIPKSLAILNSEKFSMSAAMPLVFFYNATYPVMWVFNHTTSVILKLMGYSMVDEHELAHTDQEIKLLVEESYKHGLMNKTEYTYVDNIFEFSDKNVKDIMTPRMNMVCVFKEDSFDSFLTTVMEEKYTRYPVCEEDKDNVVGYIHVRDLYEGKIRDNITSIDNITRNILTVSHTMPINKMLKRFQKENENIALVMDEYGGTAGIVTLEDVLEEIVGNIKDEFDYDEENEYEIIDEKTFIVNGSVHLDKIFQLTGIRVPSDEYDTVNGFLMGELGNIPTGIENPIVEVEGLIFTIEKIEDRRIIKARVCKT